MTSKIDPPPYQMTGGQHVFIGVVWDEVAVRKALPPNIRPVERMTGGINIYQVAQGHVIGPYEAAYFWVDLEAYDSQPGLPARWMLAGAYGPSSKTSEALCHYYNLPIRNGRSRFEPTAGGKRAIASLGDRDIITAEIKSSPGDGTSGTFLLHYVSLCPISGKLIVNQIPGVARTRVAELVSISIDAPAGDLFAAFPIKSVEWAAEVLDDCFSFGFPRSAEDVAAGT